MNEIIFSHNYPKLWKQKTAELIDIRPFIISQDIPLNANLREYDTKTTDGTCFNLLDGKYIQLIFLGEDGIPFCTLRPCFSAEKWSYYHSKIGQIFNIIIKEKGHECSKANDTKRGS